MIIRQRQTKAELYCLEWPTMTENLFVFVLPSVSFSLLVKVRRVLCSVSVIILI